MMTLVTAAQTHPPVVNQLKEYRKILRTDSTKAMVELRSVSPALRYDLRYATTNNFMHRVMYPEGTRVTFLRRPAARALAAVAAALSKQNLVLKIFDAYRPYSVTVKFWELVHDERYVANPARGSGHNKGIAVDLTLVNAATGRELDMGTGFDNFTDTAHQDFKALPEVVLQNRLLLKTAMEEHGFTALNTEWWHFSLADGKEYEVLDLPFKKIPR